MSQLKVISLVAVVLGLACGNEKLSERSESQVTAAEPDPVSEADQLGIRNGTNDRFNNALSDNPNVTLIQVKSVDKGRPSYCSALLIGSDKRTLLTSAHCIARTLSGAGNEVLVKNIKTPATLTAMQDNMLWKTASSEDGAIVGAVDALAAIDAYILPDFTGTVARDDINKFVHSQGDLAVIKFGRDIGGGTAKNLVLADVTALKKGDLLTMVGYGFTPLAARVIRRIGTVTFDHYTTKDGAYSTTPVLNGNIAVTVGPSAVNVSVATRGSIGCEGDSGGVLKNAAGQVIGILSATYSTGDRAFDLCNNTMSNTFTAISTTAISNAVSKLTSRNGKVNSDVVADFSGSSFTLYPSEDPSPLRPSTNFDWKTFVYSSSGQSAYGFNFSPIRRAIASNSPKINGMAWTFTMPVKDGVVPSFPNYVRYKVEASYNANREQNNSTCASYRYSLDTAPDEALRGKQDQHLIGPRTATFGVVMMPVFADNANGGSFIVSTKMNTKKIIVKLVGVCADNPAVYIQADTVRLTQVP